MKPGPFPTPQPWGSVPPAPQPCEPRLPPALLQPSSDQSSCWIFLCSQWAPSTKGWNSVGSSTANPPSTGSLVGSQCRGTGSGGAAATSRVPSPCPLRAASPPAPPGAVSRTAKEKPSVGWGHPAGSPHLGRFWGALAPPGLGPACSPWGVGAGWVLEHPACRRTGRWHHTSTTTGGSGVAGGTSGDAAGDTGPRGGTGGTQSPPSPPRTDLPAVPTLVAQHECRHGLVGAARLHLGRERAAGSDNADGVSPPKKKKTKTTSWGSPGCSGGLAWL